MGERRHSRWLEERSSSKAEKGDVSWCSNWRGIMLLSIPSKVLTQVILNWMKRVVDEVLRDEQAGFRKDHSCINQIATLRIIVEQSIKWSSPLYLLFVDFGKVFDSLDREAMWRLLHHLWHTWQNPQGSVSGLYLPSGKVFDSLDRDAMWRLCGYVEASSSLWHTWQNPQASVSGLYLPSAS